MVAMQDFEKLGVFYLGKRYDLAARTRRDDLVLYDSKDLVTHGICVGMTGSGKTGLCLAILEEAALDGVPAIVVDPKGDIANLLLQFPELRAEDFAPWIDPDAVRALRPAGAAEDDSTAALAAEEAARWRKELAAWGITPERIAALRAKTEFVVYTPGSDAARGISVLASLAAPDPGELDTGAEGLREKIAGTVSALLGLIGVEADPVRSREHILLSNIFETAWRQGRDLDLQQLILQINQPPFAKLGAFDVDTFFPEKERFELATAFNGLIAAPAFRTWLEGEPLDVPALLRAPDGRARVSLFYIAHLSEPERMFFVTLLLEQVQAWLRKQAGTTNLRALLYIDEVYGYFPPYPANPPSKNPLMRLLKEARAFGLGVMLVTQNPMDLDYKGLTNAGTWFVGKLQTDRDKARVLDGLEGVGGQQPPRERLDHIISALDTRVFVLHNVHAEGPCVFEARWAMSYLRGPLTRAELRRLVPVQTPTPSPQAERGLEEGAGEAVLPSDIRQYYLPVVIPPDQAVRRWAQNQGQVTPPAYAANDVGLHYMPGLLAQGVVRFFDRKSGVNEEQVACSLPRTVERAGVVRWEESRREPIDPKVLGQAPFGQAAFDPVPPPLANVKKLAALEKDFLSYLYRSMALSLWYNPTLTVFSAPGQSEEDFRAACEATVRQMRDAEVGKVQARYQARQDALQVKLAAEERKRQALEAEVQARKQEETLTNVESLLDLVTRRRIRRPASTAQRERRQSEQAQLNLGNSRAKIAELQQQAVELDAQKAVDVQAAAEKWGAGQDAIQPVRVTPKKSDLHTELFGVAWIPFWRVKVGEDTLLLPAFEV